MLARADDFTFVVTVASRVIVEPTDPNAESNSSRAEKTYEKYLDSPSKGKDNIALLWLWQQEASCPQLRQEA